MADYEGRAHVPPPFFGNVAVVVAMGIQACSQRSPERFTRVDDASKVSMHIMNPSIELLEDRIAPAAVFARVSGHHLYITGSAGDDILTLTNDDANLTSFDVTGTANGTPVNYVSPAGITDVSVSLLTGSDRFQYELNNHGKAVLPGSLTIKGTGDAKMITVGPLELGKNFSFTNGKSTTGETNVLLALNAGGNVTVKTAGGDTRVEVNPGFSVFMAIKGNLTVTNGTGVDQFILESVNIGGNVTINDGAGSNGQAGYAQFSSMVGSPAKSVIKGNLSLTFADGTGTKPIAIEDYYIGGNLKISDGTGTFTTEIGQLHVAQPVVVHGNVTIKGSSSPLTLLVGQNQTMGLDVLKNLTVSGGTDDTLTLYNLHVEGATKFKTGNGANQVTIDDSIFAGTFNLTGGSSSDLLSIESTSGSQSPTVFEKAALIHLGTGGNIVSLATGASPHSVIAFEDSFIIHHGPDPSTITKIDANLYGLFGDTVQWVN